MLNFTTLVSDCVAFCSNISTMRSMYIISLIDCFGVVSLDNIIVIGLTYDLVLFHSYI